MPTTKTKLSALAKNAGANLGPSNLPDLRQLADFLNETGLEEIELDVGGTRVRLKRPGTAPLYGSYVTATAPSITAPVAATTPSHASATAAPANTFTSPMVGTVYHAASPETPAFVKIGDTVKAGQTLCIIEAMKTMNQIESDRAGTLTEILIPNGTPVEFGQPLFVIK